MSEQVYFDFSAAQPLAGSVHGGGEYARSVLKSLLESEERSEEHESLADRLRNAAGHFEESHPTLTAAVGRIADALSAIGV